MVLFERYPQARPAGNILNLWPPPIKALGLMGVDVQDLGAPSHSEFRRVDGRRRVAVHPPDDVVHDYGGGFIGLLRPQLHERLLLQKVVGESSPREILKQLAEIDAAERAFATARR
ncbi:hypothetical protein [Thermomonospora amylolytica]|uniref:hypothetical protein n=1 Tax=Thermomonospora amylolytica TaxID=1411117 RepID=UPI0018E581CB|nr:hypothetical protein [Thermomonospora amylolytica]